MSISKRAGHVLERSRRERSMCPKNGPFRAAVVPVAEGVAEPQKPVHGFSGLGHAKRAKRASPTRTHRCFV